MASLPRNHDATSETEAKHTLSLLGCQVFGQVINEVGKFADIGHNWVGKIADFGHK